MWLLVIGAVILYLILSSGKTEKETSDTAVISDNVSAAIEDAALNYWYSDETPVTTVDSTIYNVGNDDVEVQPTPVSQVLNNPSGSSDPVNNVGYVPPAVENPVNNTTPPPTDEPESLKSVLKPSVAPGFTVEKITPTGVIVENVTFTPKGQTIVNGKILTGNMQY